MKFAFRTFAIAAATFVGALLFSFGASEQNGVSLSVSKADAQARVYIRTGGYAVSPSYYTADGLPWYAVRAYYFGGPWSGMGYSYTGWSDYAGRNGIGC